MENIKKIVNIVLTKEEISAKENIEIVVTIQEEGEPEPVVSYTIIFPKN